MNLRFYLVLICFSFTKMSFAQDSTKVYFIEKIEPSKLFSNPSLYSPDMKLQSVGVEIYKYHNDVKEDSSFVFAQSFKNWKDSIAFRIKVPNRLITDKTRLILSPIFYLKKTKNKGELSKNLMGKEQSVRNIVLKIKSDPIGAKVFLIPTLYWELDPELAKFNPKALSPYLVTEGLTTVTTNVQEYVYMVIFQYKKKFFRIQCSPNHLHTVDSVFNKLH